MCPLQLWGEPFQAPRRLEVAVTLGFWAQGCIASVSAPPHRVSVSLRIQLCRV